MPYSVSKHLFRIFGLFLSFLLLFSSTIPVFAWTNGMAASVVVGQQDFVSNSLNGGGSISASGFNYPYSVATDGTHLMVLGFNNRVLIWNHMPTTNNTPADVVIGQPNMTSGSQNQGGSVSDNTLATPQGLYYDTSTGKLFVSDYGNNRVLIYNKIPTSNNTPADVVIGQPNMASRSSNQGGSPTANTLSTPQSVYVDPASGKLFIGDAGNNRILIYTQVPTSNNASANVVIGQPNMTSGAENQGPINNIQAYTLSPVYGMIVVNGKLIVADGGYNDRVLIYNSIPTSNDASADVVIGQPDMTSNTSDINVSPTRALNFPTGVATDGTKLFILDGNYNRILVYNTIPTTNFASADSVVGQPNFTTHSDGTSATTLSDPEGQLVYANHQLIVGDSGNNRVLIFNDDSVTPTPTSSPPTPTPTPQPAVVQNPNDHPDFEKTVNAGDGFVGDLTPISSPTNTTTGTAQALIPNNASVNALFVSINPVDTATTTPVSNSSSSISTQTIPPPPPTLNPVSAVFNYQAVSAFNGYPIKTADKPFTVIIPYDSTKLTNVPTSDLKIAYLDVNTNTWKILNNNTVINPITHIVANTTTQFTAFTVVDSRSFGNSNNTNTNPNTTPTISNTPKLTTKFQTPTPIPTKAPKQKPTPAPKQCFINFFGVNLLCH